MRFKDFEIRPTVRIDGKTVKNKYDVVKWYKTDEPIEVTDLLTGEKTIKDTFCYTVATIEWYKKEPCWEFRSVGTRFLEDYEDGLCEYILKYLELFDICEEKE